MALGGALAHVVAVARGDRAAGADGHRVPLRRGAPAGLAAGAVPLPSGTAIGATVVLGVAGTVLAFALFLCTAMIYASLPFLREWASPLTVVNYTLMGGASGFALAAAFAAVAAPDLPRFYAGWALVLTLLGAGLARRVAGPQPAAAPKSTLQTALGIKHPASSRSRRASWAARSTPASSSTAAGVVAAQRQVAVPRRRLRAAGGAARRLPGGRLDGVAAAGLPGAVRGLLAERWYFFAEANHPQNLYYQAVA